MKTMIRTLALAVGVLSASMAYAETAKIAVAANFTKTIEEVGKVFEKETGHQVKFSFGPTGKLYAQIKNARP